MFTGVLVEIENATGKHLAYSGGEFGVFIHYYINRFCYPILRIQAEMGNFLVLFLTAPVKVPFVAVKSDDEAQ